MPYCPSCALGVPMHPSFVYEVMFHGVAFFVLIKWSGRLGRPGDSFRLYLLAYALFRFAVEFVRDNPVFAFGLSGSQVFLLTTVPLGMSLYVARSRSGATTTKPAATDPGVTSRLELIGGEDTE